MTKTEYRDAVRALLAAQVAELSLDDKLAIIQQSCIDAQESSGFDEGNKGKSWTDEELRVVLQHAPTKENCILLAGGGCGTLKTGRHIRYAKETPLNNLWLSMLDRMELKVTGLGDGTGKLSGLS